MSRMTIQKRDAKARPKRWVVLFFVVSFVLGSLFHSGSSVTGSAQANEAHASSGQLGDATQMKVHLPGRHASGGKLPGQVHSQITDCAGGCGLCGPVQTVDIARPQALLMPEGPARQAGMSPHTTAPPLRPPIFQA